MAKIYRPDEFKGSIQNVLCGSSELSCRYLPNYLLGSLITLPTDFRQLYQQAMFGLIFANNIGYWLQTSYFDYEAFNPLLNLWSLAVELQFYLLFSVIYPLFHQKQGLLFLDCSSL